VLIAADYALNAERELLTVRATVREGPRRSTQPNRQQWDMPARDEARNTFAAIAFAFVCHRTDATTTSRLRFCNGREKCGLPHAHKEINMHAVVRTYSGTGAKQLFDVLEQRKADVETTVRKVPGLVSYTLLGSGDGGMSVTVCQDKAGIDESLKVAGEWIKKNASNIPARPPAVTEGLVIVQIK
jgi:hypothetical protein